MRRIVSLTPCFSEVRIVRENTNRFSGFLVALAKLLKQLGNPTVLQPPAKEGVNKTNRYC